jgi:hypothetical protein
MTVRILAIFTRPVKVNIAEIANGKIISQVIANASEIISCFWYARINCS